MYKALNEANGSGMTFDQIYDMAKGTINVATGMAKSNKADSYSYSSIAKAASKMVAVFPVLTSRTVSAETAQMVTKYIEQKMCNLFVLALQQANISTAKSGIEYLRRYHQNLDVGGDNINAIINTMDTWINAYDAGKIMESASFSSNMTDVDESYYFDSLFECDHDLQISARDVAEIMKIMQEQEKIHVYDTQLNPVSINDYIVNEFASGDYRVSVKPMSAFMEAKNTAGLRKEYRDMMEREGISREEALQRQADDDADKEYASRGYSLPEKYRQGMASGASYDTAAGAYSMDKADEDYRRYRTAGEDEKRRRNDENTRRQRETNRYNQQQRDAKEARSDRNTARNEHRNDRKRQARERADQETARRSSGSNVSLKDFDVKKMNDAIPSMLVVRFYSMLDDGSVSTVPTEFIVGVKSKLIPVTTDEILRRIMNDNKDGKKFLKFMRVMTGELSAGNVLFGFSRMKDDIKSTRRKGAYGDIWNLLANRAAASREAVKHGMRNDFSAITTVVISQNDADELYREENFDITDPKNALHFMESYNLIAFVIADDATESLKIMMDDGEKNFEEYAYRMFERESKDGTYKKLINLMAASK